MLSRTMERHGGVGSMAKGSRWLALPASTACIIVAPAAAFTDLNLVAQLLPLEPLQATGATICCRLGRLNIAPTQ